MASVAGIDGRTSQPCADTGPYPVLTADAEPSCPWRTIESAPHSTLLMIFVPRADQPSNLPVGSTYVAYLTQPEPPLMQTWRHGNGPGRGTQCGWPTHWMPLPDPPRAPQAAVEGAREEHLQDLKGHTDEH